MNFEMTILTLIVLTHPLSLRPGPAEVFVLPGFPVLNSPLQINFYVRVPSGGNASVSLDRAFLTNILQSFLQNLTATFGVQFAGKN